MISYGPADRGPGGVGVRELMMIAMIVVLVRKTVTYIDRRGSDRDSKGCEEPGERR